MADRKTIPSKIQNLLWARAAGRCEFEGCNHDLTSELLTQDTENEGQIAHIIAASQKGPRGTDDSANLQDKIENLMLLCPEHHKLIDGDNRTKYTVDCLREMKRKHEDRIALATGITPDKQSLVVIYTSSIGVKVPNISLKDAVDAMFPLYYPTSNSPIILSQKSSLEDDEMEYWQFEKLALGKKFNQQLDNIIESGISNISLFAIAPQPMLVYLGTLFGDIQKVSVYQKHREPDTWRWLDPESDNSFCIKEPEDKSGKPVLVFSISAKNIETRIREMYKEGESIWIVTCNEPNNDMLVSPKQLSEFRTCARKVLDVINTSSSSDYIKVHMAMPVACAVEFGRVRMPKADKAWVLYDYHRDTETELETITIQ